MDKNMKLERGVSDLAEDLNLLTSIMSDSSQFPKNSDPGESIYF